MMTGKKTMSFEDSLAKLEIIVEKLESNELPLEEALKLFQEGVTLEKSCSEQLAKVEKEVQKVMENSDGSYSLEPLEEVEEE